MDIKNVEIIVFYLISYFLQTTPEIVIAFVAQLTIIQDTLRMAVHVQVQ